MNAKASVPEGSTFDSSGLVLWAIPASHGIATAMALVAVAAAADVRDVSAFTRERAARSPRRHASPP